MGLQGREVIPGLGEIVARHAGKWAHAEFLACSYPAEGARSTTNPKSGRPPSGLPPEVGATDQHGGRLARTRIRD